MSIIRLSDLIDQRQAISEVAKAPATKSEVKKEVPIVESTPDTDGNGMISPSELHSHFDCNGDGKVDIVDYAAHILFHIENPQYLRAYNAAASERLVQSPLAARMNKFAHRGASPGPSTFPAEN